MRRAPHARAPADPQGACNNYAQLSGVRILLGWFESVVTPGFAVLTSSWYLRNEQTLRQGMYYSMSASCAQSRELAWSR